MSSTVSGTQLQSSVERPCPGERVEFTCTMLLDISGVLHPLTSLKLSMLQTWIHFFDSPFEFGVFMVDQGTAITSIARVTAIENLMLVLCQDGVGMEPEQNITINLSGEYTVRTPLEVDSPSKNSQPLMEF